MDGQSAASSSASQNRLFNRTTEYLSRITKSYEGYDYKYDTGVHILSNPGLWINLVFLSDQGFTLDVFPVNLDGKPVHRCRHHICNKRELAAAVADYNTCRQSEAWADIKDKPVLAVLDGLLQHLQQA